MISSRHTQSLTDFRQNSTKTLDRINKTGDAEILTVNGEARAVLVSPSMFDKMAKEALLAADVAVMKVALEEIRRGEGQDLEAVFDELKATRRKLKSKRGKRPHG